MKPFFFLDFFQTGGAKVALTAGIFLVGLGLTVLFFPELLRALIGGTLIAAGIPFLVYGLRALLFFTRRRGGNEKENATIYFS